MTNEIAYFFHTWFFFNGYEIFSSFWSETGVIWVISSFGNLPKSPSFGPKVITKNFCEAELCGV